MLEGLRILMYPPLMIRVLVLQGLFAQSALAATEGDWFASLYTSGGVELRPDNGVFTLFSVFNAVGLDHGAIVRSNPVPKTSYPKVRELVRSRVLGVEAEVRRAADAFLDAHQIPLDRYLAYALSIDAPSFDHPPASGELKGLDQLLRQAWTGWRLEELVSDAQAAQRQALKAWLPVLDEPLGRAKEALRSPGVEVVLIVNLLDAPDTARAVAGGVGRIFLIVGPTASPDVELIIRELARFLIEPLVARQAGRWAAGRAVLLEAQQAGAREKTVEALATQALSTAVALKAVGAAEARWDAASSGGYFGIRDAAKLLYDAKPLDGWVLDAMHKLETRRPAKK